LQQIFFLKKYPFSIWPPLAWFIFITILLCLPGSALPEENWFDKIWLDKWIHIGLFSIMVILWCRVYSIKPGKKIRFFLYISLSCFLYGIMMEFAQKYLIPNRSFDLGDIAADGVGCAIGFLFATRVYIKK
jgi:VanZ family protein